MSAIDTHTDMFCTRCGVTGEPTANVPSADPSESANLCAACLRAYLCAIEPTVDMPGAVRVGDGARLTRGDGYEVVDTRPTDIAWEVSHDDRPMTTITFAGLPEIRLADDDAEALARSIVDGSPDAVRGGGNPAVVADDKCDRCKAPDRVTVAVMNHEFCAACLRSLLFAAEKAEVDRAVLAVAERFNGRLLTAEVKDDLLAEMKHAAASVPGWHLEMDIERDIRTTLTPPRYFTERTP